MWEVRGKIFLEGLDWHIPVSLSSIPVGLQTKVGSEAVITL